MLSKHALITILAACLLAGCATQPQSSTAQLDPVSVDITGSPGASIRAFYIAGGNRSEISATLPISLHIHGISTLAFAKTGPSDEVTASVKSRSGSMSFSLSRNENRAAILELQSGFSGSYVPPAALNPPAKNALIVIQPYWYADTWVFDDAGVGLSREAFIRGVPDMINALVKDIPNARQGFRLTASENPFPGYQKKLTWLRAESGGNFYRLNDPALDGWLCPALFLYFNHTPKTLYVKAEPLSPQNP